MEDLTLLVMAAGMGSRYGGLKQIDAVGTGGEAIIDYSVYDAVKAGFNRVVFVITKEIDRPFREKIGDKISTCIHTDYAYQELSRLPDGYALPAGRTKPWGTAHAVLCAADKINGSFAVINSDDFYGRETFEILADCLRSPKKEDGVYNFCMVGFVLENTVTENGHVSRGVCAVDENGYLKDITERTKIVKRPDGIFYAENDADWHRLDGGTTVSMNCWGFSAGILDEIKAMFPRFLDKNAGNDKAEFYLPSAVDELLRDGKCRVKVLRTGAKWFGVTYREDKPVMTDAIKRMSQEGVYPSPLWD